MALARIFLELTLIYFYRKEQTSGTKVEAKLLVKVQVRLRLGKARDTSPSSLHKTPAPSPLT
jgi:hypothetical protein